jgi:hypothetical protein
MLKQIPTLDVFSWQPPVISILDTPPAGEKGDRYIVGEGTDDWLGEDNNIAWYDTSWNFTEATDGMTVFNMSTESYLTFDITSDSWISPSVGGADTEVQFNDSGVLGGDSFYTWNKYEKRLSITAPGYVMTAAPLVHNGTDYDYIEGGNGAYFLNTTNAGGGLGGLDTTPITTTEHVIANGTSDINVCCLTLNSVPANYATIYFLETLFPTQQDLQDWFDSFTDPGDVTIDYFGTGIFAANGAGQDYGWNNPDSKVIVSGFTTPPTLEYDELNPYKISFNQGRVEMDVSTEPVNDTGLGYTYMKADGKLYFKGLDNVEYDLTGYIATETDPAFTAWLATPPNVSIFTNDAGYLTVETDPVYSASSWFTTTNNSTDWDTAYGWGDHAGLYDLVGAGASAVAGHELAYDHTLIATALQSETDPVFSAWLLATPPLYSETDPVYSGSSWFTTTNNADDWDAAYGWGDHADAGYLTSLTGAVLTDQTTGQTIGDTTNRLTKLWATDITVTNAITGSVTGNAGTVTVGNEASDTSCFPLFGTAATGSLSPKTNAGLTFNSSTGLLYSTGLSTLTELVGSDANFTDFPNAKMVVSQGNTSYSGVPGNIALALESVASGDGVDAISLYSFAKLNGSDNAIAVSGRILRTASTDTGTATGGRFQVQLTHDGINAGVVGKGDYGTTNYGGFFNAGYFINPIESGNNYGVYAAASLDITGNSYGVYGYSVVSDTTNTSAAYGGFFLSNNTHSGGPNYGAYFGAANGSVNYGILTRGDTTGAGNGYGIKAEGNTVNTADTGTAYAGHFEATEAHAGGENYGLYTKATSGTVNYGLWSHGTDYSFYGVEGKIYNEDQLLIGPDASLTDFVNAKAIISLSNTGKSNAERNALVLETTTTGSTSANGIYVAVGVENSTDTGVARAGQFISNSTHDGNNYAIYADADNGVSNFSFYGIHGQFYNAEGIRTKISNANVSNPPTDAQLDSAFGDPTTKGTGWIGVLDDAGAGTNVYFVYTTGNAGEWYYVLGSKAV